MQVTKNDRIKVYDESCEMSESHFEDKERVRISFHQATLPHKMLAQH